MTRCKSLYCPHIQCNLLENHQGDHKATNGLSWDNTFKIENNQDTEYSHYFKDVSKLQRIDVYRVLELFSVTDPCIQHAIKKLLVAGGRGSKDIDKDIEEAIVSLKRFQQMKVEDAV